LSIVTVLNGPDKWEFVPASMIISMFASYVFGCQLASLP